MEYGTPPSISKIREGESAVAYRRLQGLCPLRLLTTGQNDCRYTG
jgi:hypothetical protein